jgi:MYXO-CTERM domain-containing protein
MSMSTPRVLLAAAVLTASLALVRVAQADCASYCAAVTANCTGANAQYAGADANAQCLATCAHFAPGSGGEMTGATLACREYWAGQSVANASDNCPKAGPAGATTCGVQCNNFCDLSLAACTATNTVYADGINCFEECFTFYEANDEYTADASDLTDSFRCRMYQLTAATTDASQCANHGGPNAVSGSSTVCVQPIGPSQGGNGGSGAGTGGNASSGGGSAAGGSGGDAASGGAASSSSSTGTPMSAPPGLDDGCSCSAGPKDGGSWAWLIALVPVFWRRRRS